VRKNRYPLACYFFSEDNRLTNSLIEKIEFGGGCINDAIIHYANGAFPFGGVMTSGMGRYHGKHSFDTFSHAKPIIRSVSLIDTHIWYPPYSKTKQRIVETLIK
jgi:aldehyde dehydrogenase (NAD+)